MKSTQLINFINEANDQLNCLTKKGGRAASQAMRLESSLEKFKRGLEVLEKDNSILTIGIVGQMKAGKSSFLNALMFEGKEVLPIAATPMTAGLTIIEYADSIENQRYEVEYYSKEDWEDIKSRSKIFKEIQDDLIKENPKLASRSQEKILEEITKAKCKEEDYACYLLDKNAKSEAIMKIDGPNDVERFNITSNLRDVLADYVGANGKYTSAVKALHIFIHNECLTYKNQNTGLIESYRIVDTPGVNDPVVSRQRQTEKFLLEAHVVFMLTRADTFLPEADINFINAHISKEGVSQIILVANKLDLLFATDTKCPHDLNDAIVYETEDLEKQLEKRVKFLNTSPIALCCTAGIAECIRLKLINNPSNPQLDEEEKLALKRLSENFPDDFKDYATTIQALDLIADFPTIIEDYIQGTVLNNKEIIIEQKVSDYIECHRSAMQKEFNSIIKEIDKELSLARDYDMDTIETQISALQSLQEIAIPRMQTRINRFTKSLKDIHVTNMFETELIQYKPHLIDDYCDFKSISYTRKGTVFGGTKSCAVYADVINPSHVTSSINSQIDNLRSQINRKWTSKYNAEEDSVKNDLLDAIKDIANTDNSLNINVDVFELIIMRCITEGLCGKSLLSLDNKCSEQKKQMAEYINLTEHTNFSRTFGSMSEEDADEKIKNQARDKKNNFELSMSTRNQNIYKELRQAVEKHCESINDIMREFANNLVQKIKEQLSIIREEKMSTMHNIEAVCTEISSRKDTINNLLNEFNKL